MSLQEQIDADALEAQKFTRKHFVVGLDFSMDSVNQLDPLCDDVQFALRGGKSDENIELLTRLWGAYLGEVIRRSAGGEWRQTTDAISLICGELTLLPHAQIRSRLLDGEQHDLCKFAASTQ